MLPKLTVKKVIIICSSIVIAGLAILLVNFFWIYIQARSIHAENFQLKLDYGIYGKNQLNTFDNTFTKDLITHGNIKTKLKLHEEDLQKIFIKMQEIHFFDYPSEFKSTCPFWSQRAEIISYDTNYKFHVVFNGKTKDITWKANTICMKPWINWENKTRYFKDKQSEQLMDLINTIIDIIKTYPEYQKLPKPNGGYA